MHFSLFNVTINVANSIASYQPGASTQDGGVNTGARQDPQEHTGGGLNLIFVIIPVVAVVVITAAVVLAVLVCRR